MLISILTWETTDDDTTLHMVNGTVRKKVLWQSMLSRIEHVAEGVSLMG